MIGEPERIRTERSLSLSTSECAIVRQRRRWPRPKRIVTVDQNTLMAQVLFHKPADLWPLADFRETIAQRNLDRKSSFNEEHVGHPEAASAANRRNGGGGAVGARWRCSGGTEGNRRTRADAQSFHRQIQLAQQVLPLVLTAISFPFLYYSYDLPKTIVNRAIGGKNFPQQFFGLALDQVHYLLILCGVFLALVFINGAFKYYINVLKGRLGERMLRRLRFELYHRLLRFPVGHFKRVNPGELIPMVTSEVEQLGGFIGDAFVLPIFQGGQLVTTIFFMFIQDPGAGRRRGRALSDPGLSHPEAAAQGEPARQAARAPDPPGRRPDRRERLGHGRDPCQRRGPPAARQLHPDDGADLRHPLRGLSAEVFRQVSQQLPRAADALLLLCDRRLSGDPGQSLLRRPRRRAGRLQGSQRAVERAPDLLSAQGECADHLRPGGRAVQSRGIDRSEAAARSA